MSSQTVDVAAEAPETHRVVADSRPARVDAALSREVGRKEQLEAQNHDRNEPEESIYDRSHCIGEPSFARAGILGGGTSSSVTSAIPESELDRAGRLQGMERGIVEPEEPREAGDLDGPLNTEPLVSSEGVGVDAEISERESSNMQISIRQQEKLPDEYGTRPRTTSRSSRSFLDPQSSRDMGEYEPVAPDKLDNNSNGEGSSAPARGESKSRDRVFIHQTQSWREANTVVNSPSAPAGIPDESSPNYSENGEALSESVAATRTENASPPAESSSALGSSPVQESPRPGQEMKANSSPEGHDIDGVESSASVSVAPAPRSGSDEEPSRSWGESPQQSPISPIQSRHASRTRVEFVVPRWQPDAEVTICPICRTQFSFFIRKHHCRKCGRVVCNSCSPHRITIPYQFIVQPPTEGDASTSSNSNARPAIDTAHSGSSSEFASLGGGERVRLCNPCVPDPNTAPPQTPQFDGQLQQSQRISHSRSASSITATSYSPFGLPQTATSPQGGTNRPMVNIANFRPTNRPATNANTPRGTSFNPHSGNLHNNTGSTYEGWRESRSRSSTVSGNSHDAPADVGSLNRSSRVPAAASQFSQPGASSNLQPHYRSLVPRDEHHIHRPLPRPPRIAEEDECPVCHQELPSSALPNSEALRATHISNCIETALRTGTGTPPPPPPTPTPIPPPARTSNAPSSSSSTPVPIANTPEARMAAREQAHAAIVLGRSSPTPHFRPTGVFPYRATEKDCVDDAECTICLEEFEVGQNMGRLECFCRFHLHCIREWFVDHYGQCPVHQHGF